MMGLIVEKINGTISWSFIELAKYLALRYEKERKDFG
jgi:hypothetical protein